MPLATATAHPPLDTATRTSGRVLWFSPKGFGMITAADGTQVYVHHSRIRGSGFRSLATDAQVTFEVRATPRGPEAVDVDAS